MLRRATIGLTAARCRPTLRPTMNGGPAPVAAVLRCAVALSLGLPCLAASDYDVFKVKREGPFEFARKPAVTREGDRVTITFETKAFCDVTVAIEDSSPPSPSPPRGEGGGEGSADSGVSKPSPSPNPLPGRERASDARIVRHLACGVLGPNAPEPFQKNTKKQTIIWDGKDDQGRYLDERKKLSVRVSLGLRPRFERTLLWSPKRRFAGRAPLIVAAEEGVYVYEGEGVDHLRLFDHDGNYVRTIYPFPAGQLPNVQGLDRVKFPQLVTPLPLKRSAYRNTLLTAGENGTHCLKTHSKEGLTGNAAAAMAVQGNRIALVKYALNRLATDGSSGGLGLTGPATTFGVPASRVGTVLKNARFSRAERTLHVAPRSAALSPDGAWLYLTAYQWIDTRVDYLSSRMQSLHGVMRVRYAGDDPPAPFVGDMQKRGSDDARFSVPTSVDCDATGRVYVADCLNDRVQVFSPEAKHLATIPVKRPAQVRVHRPTGDVYVFSWVVPTALSKDRQVAPTLTRLSPFPAHKVIASYPIPGVGARRPGADTYAGWGRLQYGEIDPWAKPLTVWISSERSIAEVFVGTGKDRRGRWRGSGPRLYAVEDGRLVERRDFHAEGVAAVGRPRAPRTHSQYLYVNPKTGLLYVGEAEGRIGGAERAMSTLIEIDPETGRRRNITLPHNSADLDFDQDGLAYLRVSDTIVRYNLRTGKEVPWDYGIERRVRGKPVVAGLLCPRVTWWIWQGGFSVAPNGNIAVFSILRPERKDLRFGKALSSETGWAEPKQYPGRPAVRFVVNVWDRYGRLLHRDAVPGIGMIEGIELDARGDITLVAHPARMLDGKRYFIPTTGTLMKVTPGANRILSRDKDIPVPLPAGDQPKRPPDIAGSGVGSGWVEGAHWFYGGVGFSSQNANIHCHCWHTRFAADAFGRSFAPEPDLYRVAVLDTNGNLLLHVGRCGNADDGTPLAGTATGTVPFSGEAAARKRGLSPSRGSGASAEAERGTGTSPRLGASPRFRAGPRFRAIGGDEVALFFPQYLATHTDRRLFIADAGNARIVSVRLDYAVVERASLKNVQGRDE